MRTTNAPASRKRRAKMISMAKGYRGRRSKLYRYASDAVDHGLKYAFRDRRAKKRSFRALWIQRINAGCRPAGIPYGRFIDGLKKASIIIDRKILAELAVSDSNAFAQLIASAKKALGTKTA